MDQNTGAALFGAFFGILAFVFCFIGLIFARSRIARDVFSVLTESADEVREAARDAASLKDWTK